MANNIILFVHANEKSITEKSEIFLIRPSQEKTKNNEVNRKFELKKELLEKKMRTAIKTSTHLKQYYKKTKQHYKIMQLKKTNNEIGEKL